MLLNSSSFGFFGGDVSYYGGLWAGITTNLIHPDGHIDGLDLTSDASLLVRNYRGAQAPRIVVDYQLVIDSTGALRLVFDADQWDSVISFAPDIPITLDGTLDLEFADGIDIDRQVGRTFRIFDWTGVTPAGSFGLSSPYAWDLSQLYTAGQITLVPEPASLALLGAVGTASLYVRRTNPGHGKRAVRLIACPRRKLSPRPLKLPAKLLGGPVGDGSRTVRRL